MGKFSTLMLSNIFLFLNSFTVCSRYSLRTHNIAADIYLTEIKILCLIKQPPLFCLLFLNGARHLNIRDARKPPSYLWSCCHNKDKANIEPQNLEKANSVIGSGSTGLKPRSACPHLSHVASESNIST